MFSCLGWDGLCGVVYVWLSGPSAHHNLKVFWDQLGCFCRVAVYLGFAFWFVVLPASFWLHQLLVVTGISVGFSSFFAVCASGFPLGLDCCGTVLSFATEKQEGS